MDDERVAVTEYLEHDQGMIIVEKGDDGTFKLHRVDEKMPLVVGTAKAPFRNDPIAKNEKELVTYLRRLEVPEEDIAKAMRDLESSSTAKIERKKSQAA